MKSTITFSKKDIGDIVKAHLREQGYTGITNFSFDIGSRLEGYGPNERYEPYFGGIDVDVDVKPVVIKKKKRTTVPGYFGQRSKDC